MHFGCCFAQDALKFVWSYPHVFCSRDFPFMSLSQLWGCETIRLIVFESWSWSHGALRPLQRSLGLGSRKLGLGTCGLGLSLGLAS